MVQQTLSNTYARFMAQPDHIKIPVLLAVYGLVALGLVYGLGLEGTGGSYTGLNGVSQLG